MLKEEFNPQTFHTTTFPLPSLEDLRAVSKSVNNATPDAKTAQDTSAKRMQLLPLEVMRKVLASARAVITMCKVLRLRRLMEGSVSSRKVI